MDVEKLLKALDNDSNESLLNFNTKKMRNMNLNILKELNLNNEETEYLYEKLLEYKYIDELKDLKQGTIIRWISLINPEDIKLSNPAIFCDFKIQNSCTFCTCKQFNYPYKIFKISMDKNLIFQKLTDQEKILLFALDHL
jgi:hypothetical protein